MDFAVLGITRLMNWNCCEWNITATVQNPKENYRKFGYACCRRRLVALGENLCKVRIVFGPTKCAFTINIYV